VIDIENPKGVIVSVGGQIPNNLAIEATQAGCTHSGYVTRVHRPCGEQA